MQNVTDPGPEIQIRAHCLQGLETPDSLDAFIGGRAMGQQMTGATRSNAGPRRRQWRDRDLQRAIAVARRSKLLNYRIELAPDGTISIVVGA